MADTDDNGGGRVDRLWRLEQRQNEVIAKLERLYSKVEEIATNAELQRYQVKRDVETAMKMLEELIKRPVSSGTSLFGEPTIVKIVVTGLLSLIAALAAGKAFVFPA